MFINILTKGASGELSGGALVSALASGKAERRQVHPLTAPPNGYKSKYFVRNNIYLLVIVNHCANVYLGVWKKNIHNFAQKHTNV